jgi:hypothetical protein
VNPVKAFEKAINQGKNAAANAIRVALTQLNTGFRTAINALLSGMGADPTGILSLQFSLAKDVVRKINEITKKIAQMVADIATIYYLVDGLKQIVAWIQSLPDQLKSILKTCLLNFQNSVNDTIASFEGATDLTTLQNSVTSQLQLNLTASQNLPTSANTEDSSTVTSELVNSYSSSSANAETQVDSSSQVVLVKGYIDQSVTYYLDTISLIETNTTSNMMANTSGP